MKKIVAAPFILALLIAGSYGAFGYMAKNNFNNTMAQLRSKMPNNIDITYKQGLLSSTVDMKIKIPITDTHFNLDIISNQTIYHGPFVFHAMQGDQPAFIPVQAYTEGNLAYEFTGEIDSKVAQTITEVTTTKFNAYVPLNGNAAIQFSGEPLKKEFEMEGNSIAIDWQGFKGSLNLLGSIKHFTYDFTSPGLAITGNGTEKFTVTSITSSGTARSGSFDIALGDYRAGIKNIAITLSKDQGDEITLEDINLIIVADEKDKLLTFSEFFDLKALSINNKTYGPVNTTIHLKNLDAKALSAMNQEYIAIQKANGNNPQALQAQLMQMATTHGITLLSKSPEFNLENISLRTPEGAGEIKLKISFDGDGEITMNPFSLLGRLSADASFGADERFLAVLTKDLLKESMCDDNTSTECDQQAARASREQLEQMVNANQLILENNRFVSTIHLKDGAATLNGTPMPVFGN